MAARSKRWGQFSCTPGERVTMCSCISVGPSSAVATGPSAVSTVVMAIRPRSWYPSARTVVGHEQVIDEVGPVRGNVGVGVLEDEATCLRRHGLVIVEHVVGDAQAVEAPRRDAPRAHANGRREVAHGVALDAIAEPKLPVADGADVDTRATPHPLDAVAD